MASQSADTKTGIPLAAWTQHKRTGGAPHVQIAAKRGTTLTAVPAVPTGG